METPVKAWYEQVRQRLKTLGVDVEAAKVHNTTPPMGTTGWMVSRGKFSLIWGLSPNVGIGGNEFIVGLRDEFSEIASVVYQPNTPRQGGGALPNYWRSYVTEEDLPTSLKRLRGIRSTDGTTDKKKTRRWLDILVKTFLAQPA